MILYVWCSELIIGYCYSSIIIGLIIGMFISFCFLRVNIRRNLEELDNTLLILKYLNAVTRYFFVTVFTITSPISDFIRYFDLNAKSSTFFLILEDILVCTQYTLLAIVSCVNDEN